MLRELDLFVWQGESFACDSVAEVYADMEETMGESMWFELNSLFNRPIVP